MISAGLLLTLLAVSADASSLMRDARKMYEELEYDRVVPIAEKILELPNTSVQEKLDAYLLKGSCLAVLGRTIDAESAFRLLLRVEPSFEVKSNVSPKILAVFRKVQQEERALAEQLHALERQKIVAQLAIEGLPPNTATGGEPLLFQIQVRDPNNRVASASLRYRRILEPAYSSLAMQRARDGNNTWTTKIPAEWTANDGGFQLEYFITTSDDQGRELLTAGTERAPLRIEVSSGDIPSAPFYSSTWFWVGTSALVIGSAIGGFFIFRERAGPPTDLGPIEVN